VASVRRAFRLGVCLSTLMSRYGLNFDRLPVGIIKKAIPRMDCGSALGAIKSPRHFCGDVLLSHLMSQAAFRAGKNHRCLVSLIHRMRAQECPVH
jgi:hypothetical protein